MYGTENGQMMPLDSMKSLDKDGSREGDRQQTLLRKWYEYAGSREPLLFLNEWQRHACLQPTASLIASAGC